ncbi:hypothetical protein LTR27_001610 [Elasticomyces elasticus]|nr:hypothetical protein LTR27_001610 [Elasticomyces elasticus]
MRCYYYSLPRVGERLSAAEIRTILRDDYQHLNIKLSTMNIKLADLLKRLHAGLPTYYDDSIGHLQMLLAKQKSRFAPDPYSGRGYTFKRQLIARLDELTPAPKFHRFLELPPEIRQRVCTLMCSYTDNALHLQQPAISRVCRLLRAETLPVFYKCNRFGITVDRLERTPRIRQTLAHLWPIYIKPEHVVMMRYFEVRLRYNHTTSTRIKIDLPSLRGDEALRIRVWSVTPDKYSKLLPSMQTQIEQEMRPSIERLLESRGQASFTMREVQLMALSMARLVKLDDGILPVAVF